MTDETTPRQIKALYKRLADAALPMGLVYQPKADELYVVIPKLGRHRIRVEFDPPPQ